MTGRPRALGNRYQRWRRVLRWSQAAVVLGLPFLRVGGESALRFDPATLRLHVFGAHLWIDELFLVLLGALALTLAFLLVTVTLGRVWCGYACPQTVLSDLTAPLERWRKKGVVWAAAAVLVLALASAVVAADLVWYVVPPGRFFADLAAGRLGPVTAGSWAALGLLVFVDLAFWRQRFCVAACPYAKLQGALFDRHTLIVAYDEKRASDCIDCGACVRVCPTGIDIREGLQAACIACAACIDACTPIMARLRRPPELVGYFHGEPGRPRRLGRPAVLALGAATLLALAGTVAASGTRAPLEVVVSAASQVAPRHGGRGGTVNAFLVALENHGDRPLDVQMSLVTGGRRAGLRPAGVTLAPGEHRRILVTAEVPGLAAGRHPAELVAETPGTRLASPVSFVVPEGP